MRGDPNQTSAKFQPGAIVLYKCWCWCSVAFDEHINGSKNQFGRISLSVTVIQGLGFNMLPCIYHALNLIHCDKVETVFHQVLCCIEI